MAPDHNTTFYGFTPVPRDPEVLFKDHPTASGPNPKQDPFQLKDLPFPDSPLVRQVKAYVQVLRGSIASHSNLTVLLERVRSSDLQPQQPRLYLW
jgi:cyanamide hydratase